jgi:DNA polymerase-3 subunit chi
MEVAFHFNVSAPTDYCCRLLRKAHGRGARVTVTGPRRLLVDIDQQLWALSATDFVPHAWADAAPEVRMCSPIVLCETLTPPEPGQNPPLLLNLLAHIPADYTQYERVIEVVGLGEDERAQARQRWRAYEQAQHHLTRHDAAATASAP